MKKLLSSNEWQYRLCRTILQGICGCVLANLDVIIGQFSFDPTMKPMIVALVMAILSPIMAMLGEKENNNGDELSNS